MVAGVASVDALVTLASALPLMALGALLLTVTPRGLDQVFFGLFAILWGAKVGLVNVGRLVGDPALHRVGLLASYGVTPAATLFLVRFAERIRDPYRTPWLSGAAAAAAVPAVGALVVDPGLVVADVAAAGGVITQVVYGPATLLFDVPFFAAFYLTLVLGYAAYRRAEPGTGRRHTRGLVLALAVYVSYASVANMLAFFPGSGAGVEAPASFLVYGGLFLAGSAVVAGVAAHAFLRPNPPEGQDRVLILAFLAPGAWAAVQPAVGGGQVLGVASFGLFRLVTVALLVYVLARHRLFDLDLRLRRVAGPGLAALAATLGLGWGLFQAAEAGSLTSAYPPAMAGVICAGAAFNYRHRVGSFLFPDADDAAYLHHRRLEVYTEHLERELTSPGDPDEERLEALRARLDISEREHWALEHMVGGPEVTGSELPAADLEEDHPGGGGETAPSAQGTGRASRGQDEAILDGRYEEVRVLGEGAHGRALLAHDHDRDRQVVVKTVTSAATDPGARKRLLREADLLSEVDHPNVVRVLEAVERGREVWLVLEYVEGGSLDGLLRRRGRLGVREGARLLDGVLAGLAAAHGQGIVHRDVKPANVLLTDEGEPRLTDFGVAVRAGADATRAAAGAGTLLYMSPEQVRGDEAGPPADVYAAGVLLHQVLAGRFYLPLQGRDDFQVRRLILEEPPRLRLPDEAGPVAPVLERALAKDPGERPADAGELREALAEAVPGAAADGARPTATVP